MDSDRGSSINYRKLEELARLDARLLDPDKPAAEQGAKLDELRRELRDFRSRQPEGQRSWAALARVFGMDSGGLSRFAAGESAGEKSIRRIDEVLAAATKAGDRPQVGEFVTTAVSLACFGAIRLGISHSSMPVLVGSPGAGKTLALRAFVGQSAVSIYVCVTPEAANARGLSSLLAHAINQHLVASGKRGAVFAGHSHPRRVAALCGWLRGRSAVLLIDEAQRLKASGLDLLRALHDASEVSTPNGPQRVPIVLAGDHTFLRLVVGAKGAGEPLTKGRPIIAPQLARRLWPVVDLDRDVPADGDPRKLFTLGEVKAVLSQQRLRLVDDEGLRFCLRLANDPHAGRLGLVVAVVRLAFDLADGPRIGLAELYEASKLVFGTPVEPVVPGVRAAEETVSAAG